MTILLVLLGLGAATAAIGFICAITAAVQFHKARALMSDQPAGRRRWPVGAWLLSVYAAISLAWYVVTYVWPDWARWPELLTSLMVLTWVAPIVVLLGLREGLRAPRDGNIRTLLGGGVSGVVISIALAWMMVRGFSG